MSKIKDPLGLLSGIFKEGLANYAAMHETGVTFSKNACFTPGDGYSAIISVEEIKKREAQIWANKKVNKINGIDLRENDQLKLVKEFKKYYRDIPFTDQKKNGFRYFFHNNWYTYSDGVVLYSMIKHFKPRRIIEVGSGFSSALMMDMKQHYDPGIQLTFIDPDPTRLYTLLTESDKTENRFIISAVQDVDIAIFKELEENDILFIDSSHVSKTGSDINFLLYDILPVLKKGVIIHFHDIFYPFEYPKEWVYKGQNWNEGYILKAFLMYNDQFQIKLFSDYLFTHHLEAFKDMPLCYLDHGGCIWIQKV